MSVKRLLHAFSIMLMLLALVLSQQGRIPKAIASPSMHQGDLILQGNNVTVIEGLFDINGSIVIEENATLILRNAVLNFTQSHSYQFRMNIQNPLGGNPRLIAENATITSVHSLYVQSYANGSIRADGLFSPPVIRFFAHDESVVILSNSSLYELHAYSSTSANVSDSELDWLVGEGTSDITATNCTLVTLRASGKGNFTVTDSEISYDIISEAFSVNCSINNLRQGLVEYWNFGLNSSVIVAPVGQAPNVTLLNTEVSSWSFLLHGLSNGTISNCRLMRLGSHDTAVLHVYNSANDGWASAEDLSYCYLYGSAIDMVEAHQNATSWLVNSTYKQARLYDYGKIFVSWFLDVHVVDQISQDIPSANVTAYPAQPILFPLSVSESGLTDLDGRARLTLTEKMLNATGEYSVGNYTIEAAYETHSASTSVNMTENRQTTLALEDFIVPEFPSAALVPLFGLILAALMLVSVYIRLKRMTPTGVERQSSQLQSER